MGNRRSNTAKRRNTKSSRSNESQKTKTIAPIVAELTASALDGSEVWDTVTLQELRQMIGRYGHYQLRFPAKLVIRLLDEISRLEGQA